MIFFVLYFIASVGYDANYEKNKQTIKPKSSFGPLKNGFAIVCG